MSQASTGYSYNPFYPFSTPFTLISYHATHFQSHPLQQPFIYQVYCPISCKKIKIGCAKDKTQEAIEFNTTSSRTVSTYVNENIKYLVDKHLPNKKDKKKVQKAGWGLSVEVQDKGNIAIFNPYCVTPLEPISFYTLGKLGKSQLGREFSFTPIQPSPSKHIQLASTTVFISPDNQSISLSPFFDANTLAQITLSNPSNPKQVIQQEPQKLKQSINDQLQYWLFELKKTIDVEQTLATIQIQHNLDVIYHHLNLLLHLDEQLRCKLMSNHTQQLYHKLYPYHPRLYTNLSRLMSFYHYGNTHFDVFKLAEVGFFNKSDMLQDLSYAEYPEVPITNAEEIESPLTEEQLRNKLFPMSRAHKGLVFPNVPLHVSLKSLPPQIVTQSGISKIEVSNQYLLLVDKDFNVSLWTGEVLLIRLAQFNYKKNCKEVNREIITQLIAPVIGSKSQNLNDLFGEEEAEKQKEVPVEVKPDQTMLEQLINMGYGPSIAKKSLIQVKNQSVEKAIDAIEQIHKEQLNKITSKKTIKKDWNCTSCTFLNNAANLACEICGEVMEEVDQDLLKKKAEIQAKLALEQQTKKEKQEREHQEQKNKLELQQRQKEQITKMEKQHQDYIALSQLKDIKLLRNEASPIDPFFIIVLLRNQSHYYLRIFRIGINREQLLKFYRIEENKVVSNFTRTVYPKQQLQSYQSIAREAPNRMEWWIKLFEQPTNKDWIVIDILEKEIEGQFKQIHITGNTFKLEGDKPLAFTVATIDTMKQSKFQLKEANIDPQQMVVKKQNKQRNGKISKQQKSIFVQPGQPITLEEGSSQILVEVLQHLPAGQLHLPEQQLTKILPDTKFQGEIAMSQFIPLAIEHYEGSVFSGKYYSTSIFDRANYYISNYPDVNFTLKSLSGRSMLVESFVIQTSNKRLQKIFPISSGLIFTANAISWFHRGKKTFEGMTKKDYQQWTQRRGAGNRKYWQPVGFFQFQQQIELELDFKRTAKYLFVLLTGVLKTDDKIEVSAVKIDFIGVKGRIQDDNGENSPTNYYSNVGTTNTSIQLSSINSQGQWNKMDEQKLIISKLCSPNTYHLVHKSDKFLKNIPLSVSTIFQVKIRDVSKINKLQIKSHHANRIKLTYLEHCQDQQTVEINSFQELVKVQNKYNNYYLDKIVERLNLKDLVQIIISTNQIHIYQNLIKKLLEIQHFKHKLFNVMCEFMTELCNDEVNVSENGLRLFLRIFQRIQVGTDDKKVFNAISQIWKRITIYVNEKRNKNYSLLRNKYKIQQLVLQPYLFSKDYYKLIHPSYIDEEKPTIISQPHSLINHITYILSPNKWTYTEYVDLLETKDINRINLYFPKITSTNRYKLIIKINAIRQQSSQQIYYRYFHEQFLVQMGIYGHRDNHIFQDMTNCLSICTNHKAVRYLQIQISFLILTSIPSHRYKQPTENMVIIPLIQSNTSQIQFQHTQTKQLLKTFPQQAKHNSSVERMPPSKFYQEGNKYIYQVHQFQTKQTSVQKTYNSEVIDKITTNIMDKAIVESCIKTININEYEFGKKGVDFAYTLLINTIRLFKRLPTDYAVSVDLMLNLFEVFIVYEIGPIMKQVSSILVEVYSRLTDQQKCVFVSAIVEKYLSNPERLKSLKLSQQFPIQKVIQVMKGFKLPTATLLYKLKQSKNKLIISTIVKLLLYDIEQHGINQQLYDGKTAKYQKKIGLDQMMLISFQVCLWVAVEVKKITEEMLLDGLELLLKFFPNQKKLSYHSAQSVCLFMNQLSEEQLWRLVFLIIQRKNETLNDRIHQFFKVLIAHPTDNFQKSINSMLLQIIKKSPGSLYLSINQQVSDDLWMRHLQTLLEYLSLANSKLFLDIDTSLSLLQLPLTPSLWSLSLHIIPRDDKILSSIIKNFPPHHYTALGKQITTFCQPLAGIRPLQTIHVNWLYLVKKIRIQGKNMFELFIEQLEKTSYGGKDGLTMALPEDVKQIEITLEFLKLVLENPINHQSFNPHSLRVLFSWYYLNYCSEEGHSPATSNFKSLSDCVLQLFQKMAEIPQIMEASIQQIFTIKVESDSIESMFKEKRLPFYGGMKINERICFCFQKLLNIFMTTDQLSSYFAFKVGGVDYILSKLGLQQVPTTGVRSESDEDFLIELGVIAKNMQSSDKQIKPIKLLADDLKEQQIANNLKFVDNVNPHGITVATKDWSTNKKGNKTKLIHLPMTTTTQQQYPLQIQLPKVCQLRSIKIGFTAAAFDTNDKLIVSPSSVTLEGGIDLNHYSPFGQMNYIPDDGYILNGVKVFVLNLLKIKKLNEISQSLKDLEYQRVKYLKFIIKRPVISMVEGYSQLNNRPFNSLGCNICFVSIMGDDCQKIPMHIMDACRERSKETALTILNGLISDINPNTSKSLANDEAIVNKFRKYFSKIKEHMKNYPTIVPPILYALGAGNCQLGDWIINQFLLDGDGEVQAKLVNQIISSTPNKLFERMNIFLKNLLRKMTIINNESEIESGLLFAKEVMFMESFSKTLQDCLTTSSNNAALECGTNNINDIINIFDKKYSSPEIKSLIRLLISLLYIPQPLKLSNDILNYTLDLVWNNCSQAKPYFYGLIASLLVNRKSVPWIQQQGRKKVVLLINQIHKSIEINNIKALKLQMFVLAQISYHPSQAEYLRQQNTHIDVYNKIKLVVFSDGQVFDHLTKMIQNVVLGNVDQQKKLANQLVIDVELLVKRKDPILQKFYVGLLGLEKEVIVSIKGMENQQEKKDVVIPTLILNKNQQKMILDKIGTAKKLKFTSKFISQGQLKANDVNTFVNIYHTSPFLIIIKLKKDKKYAYCGAYCLAKSTRSEEDNYSWEEAINYEKGSFLFYGCEGENKCLQNDGGALMSALSVCQDENDSMLSFFHDTNEMFKLPFSESNTYSFTICPKLAEYTYESLEVFEVRTFQSTSSQSPKNITFNKARPPFIYYRHTPIYIFPGRITIDKFFELLGMESSDGNEVFCRNRKITDKKIVIEELKNTTDDLIIDLTISCVTGRTIEANTGYMPQTNIFDYFSQQGGVNTVLEKGSQSIKEWKKPQIKKNFEHYMDELKSFVHLPKFFTLFIKNNQSVSFLFEVAAGLPDDPNSTRNWQQEEVQSSRFIYKIISDIFKYDRSVKLRDMEQYKEFCEIILEKLAETSKETVRALIEQVQQQNNEVEVPQAVIKKVSQAKPVKRKKKGTGYGADNQNNSKWSSTEWMEYRKNMSQEILRVATIYLSFLDCEQPLVNPILSDVIKQSCLLPLVESALRSGSLLEISQQHQLFRCFLGIIRNLARNPATLDCLLQLDKKYKPQQTESIHTLLQKLNNVAEIFSKCLKSGESQQKQNEEVAEQISLDIQKTYHLVDKIIKSKRNSKDSIKEVYNTPEESYHGLLKDLRFGYVNLKNGLTYQHFYASSLSNATPTQAKILRLSQQLADLSSSLPCQLTNSIFVRCDKSRIDIIKVLIMGSKDTPYSSGAFMFDVYCDDTYPNNPPKMSITTTGQGKVRFNPNLYSCGKVCLSLLGTWRGQASENWDPKFSTLLQLFISTQGITMSDDVYFNEPGFEGQQGTQEGEKKNEAYSNIVRLGNVRHAMNEQIKSPPKGFEDIINRHFYIKKDQILAEVGKWVQWAEKREASYTGLVNDHNATICGELKTSKTKYKELLQKEYDELKVLLSKIPEPTSKDKEEQVKIQTKKLKKNLSKAKQAKLEHIDVSYDQQTKQLSYQEDVLQDRWSRYIGAMGVEAVKKQSQSNVLLVGLKALGLEIAKNLVLSGLKKLTIVENGMTNDYSQHFYMSDLKGKKIQQCIFKIKQLNPYMLVDHSQTIPDLKGYNFVISTQTLNEAIQLSKQCRKAQIKFIHTQTNGVSGYYFGDFGKQFVINDINGEQPFEGLIKNITCEEEGVVTLHEGVKHPYQDGDYIVINKVHGMTEIHQLMQEKSQAQLFFETTTKEKPQGINGRVFKIKVINWNSFKIGDTRNYHPYLGNGICANIKVPIKVDFKPYDECIENFETNLDPNFGLYDFDKIDDNLKIHICFQALSQFKCKNNKLPTNWCEEQANEFVEIVKKIAIQYKKTEEQIDKLVPFAKKFSFISEAELPSIGAYLGGLVSQQAIKGITNKFTPIKQFFTFHFNELLGEIPDNSQDIKQRSIKVEEEFRSLKIVIGKQNSKKIQEMNTFVIGAGAIGCQLLKNFAMINMGAQGMITVTDPDHIETSNLTRQFLFRQKHVKKPKSATASATLIQMNPSLKGHISARLDKICESTEDTYTDDFFLKQTVVANALDNVRARQYVDKRCVTNKRPLFESGTLGPKGHVQVIIPHKTQNYGNQNDPAQENQIPHCTLKMFPEETVHCIQWSRDIFGKKFTLNPKALKKIIDTKNPNAIQGQQKITIKKMIDRRPLNFEDCVSAGVHAFYKYFRNNVRQLIHTYPLDMKTKQGKLFWQLPKRPPKEIQEIDFQDDMHITFITSYAVLVAKTFGVPYPKDFRKPQGKEVVMKIAKDIKVEPFIPSQQKSKELQEMQEKQQNEKIQKMVVEQPPKIQQPVSNEQIALNEDILEIKVQPEQFEKDQDSNGHIDFIYSMSNLRARNYGLAECKWIDAKLKAGRIMPALSTTTSVVAALQTIQIIKLVIGSKQWRNLFTNLAVPIIQIAQPGQPTKHKIGNTEFTVWDSWEFKASTLEDLFNQINENYKIEVFNVSTADGKPVYWEAMYKDKEEQKNVLMKKQLKDMFVDQLIELSISMRDPTSKVPYENVPRIYVTIL